MQYMRNEDTMSVYDWKGEEGGTEEYSGIVYECYGFEVCFSLMCRTAGRGVRRR